MVHKLWTATCAGCVETILSAARQWADPAGLTLIQHDIGSRHSRPWPHGQHTRMMCHSCRTVCSLATHARLFYLSASDALPVAAASASCSAATRLLFCAPISRIVVFCSSSVICSQFAIRERLPSLFTTTGPRPSRLVEPPPTSTWGLSLCPTCAGSANCSPPPCHNQVEQQTYESIRRSSLVP